MKCATCNTKLERIITEDSTGVKHWIGCKKCGEKIEDFRDILGDLNVKCANISQAREKRAKYKAQCMCLNCGWSGQLELEKGVRVKGTPCPNCECKLGEE